MISLIAALVLSLPFAKDWRPLDTALMTALVVETVYDIGVTRACLNANTCTEVNPIFGSGHPSALRQWGTNAGMLAGQFVIAGFIPAQYRWIIEAVWVVSEGVVIARTPAKFQLHFAF